jgi:hypothetical protein
MCVLGIIEVPDGGPRFSTGLTRTPTGVRDALKDYLEEE